MARSKPNPDRIVSVWAGIERGTAIIEIRDGRTFTSYARDTDGLYPKCGKLISDYPAAVPRSCPINRR